MFFGKKVLKIVHKTDNYSIIITNNINDEFNIGCLKEILFEIYTSKSYLLDCILKEFYVLFFG